jgi:type II secretory pathway component GspD/PulD (secretin)
MLHKPQVLALSGKKFEIHITDSENYILIRPADSNVLSEKPESESNPIKLGTTIRINPTLAPDGKNIELDFEWEYRRLNGVKKHKNPDGTVQKVPQIDIDSIKTPCTIPDGKTLLIAGKKIIEQKKKPGKPQLADLPVIGMLFSNPPQPEQTRNLIIMVTPSTVTKTTQASPSSTPSPIPPPIDPNDPLIKKLEEKFKHSDEQK